MKLMNFFLLACGIFLKSLYCQCSLFNVHCINKNSTTIWDETFLSLVGLKNTIICFKKNHFSFFIGVVDMRGSPPSPHLGIRTGFKKGLSMSLFFSFSFRSSSLFLCSSFLASSSLLSSSSCSSSCQKIMIITAKLILKLQNTCEFTRVIIVYLYLFTGSK